MKKFNLTIPKPCHENWDQMTPDEKGRFCGSCQKTVVDFTHMSDRELAAFFKKPAGSVCGRFLPDQLNREITVPKERIPWLRYFFHIAWPAFILMLKSCGPKDRVTGKPSITLSTNNSSGNNAIEENIIMSGIGLPDTLAEENMESIVDSQGEVAVIDVVDTTLSIMVILVLKLLNQKRIV